MVNLTITNVAHAHPTWEVGDKVYVGDDILVVTAVLDATTISVRPETRLEVFRRYVLTAWAWFIFNTVRRFT